MRRNTDLSEKQRGRLTTTEQGDGDIERTPLKRFRIGILDHAWVPKLVPFLALALLIAVFGSAPNFLSLSNLANVLRQLPVLLMVAAGETFVILTGSIDISVAGTINLSAACAAVLTQQWGEIGLLVAPLVGLAAGILNGLLVARAKLPSFLVTLGTWFGINGVALIISGGLPHPFVGRFTESFGSGTLPILGGVPYATVVALGILLACDVFALRTRYGRYIYAIGGNEEVARLSGIRVQRYKVLAFALCGALAGMAGLLLTIRASASSPTMGDPFLLTSIAAVVVGGTSLSGGIGGLRWTLLGALVIIVLDNGMTIAAVDPNYQTVIRGMAIIMAAALTLRRRGGVIK